MSTAIVTPLPAIPPELDSVLTTKMAAGIVKTSPATINRLCTERQIPSFRIGRSWRIRRADLDEWIKAQVDACVPATTPLRKASR